MALSGGRRGFLARVMLGPMSGRHGKHIFPSLPQAQGGCGWAAGPTHHTFPSLGPQQTTWAHGSLLGWRC